MKKNYITNQKETLSSWIKFSISMAFAIIMLIGSGTELAAQTGTITGTNVCEGTSTTIGLNNTIQDYHYYLFVVDESENHTYYRTTLLQSRKHLFFH